jgi:hypothetical protein
MTRTLLVVIALLSVVAIAHAQAPAQAPEQTQSITDNDDALVVFELNDGDKVIVTIVKESPGEYLVDNPLGTMRVSMPKSKVLKVRKPTAKEMEKLRGLVAQNKHQDW